MHSCCWLFRLAGDYLKLLLFASKVLSWVGALVFGAAPTPSSTWSQSTP
jgi:hypothetical protein